jgi:hypothetical protein
MDRLTQKWGKWVKPEQHGAHSLSRDLSILIRPHRILMYSGADYDEMDQERKVS